MPGAMKRASLPGAAELFRPTKQKAEEPIPAQPVASAVEVDDVAAQQAGATGRVRHDHKITVYFSEDELLALEDANLALRRTHGIRVDRGRIVRIAVARALADFEAAGAESELVSELREQ